MWRAEFGPHRSGNTLTTARTPLYLLTVVTGPVLIRQTAFDLPQVVV
jgi:hypothetical protein